jgi:2,3-bisphosphoglycerate-independent phosphoglycerate mutase
MKKAGSYKINLPLILVILDGWGIAAPNRGNAITLAKTPTIAGITKKYPSTFLCAHGSCVGLPRDQVGNSEAGHMNIGAGRIVEQDTVRISKSITQGLFFKNTAFLEAIKHAKKNKSNLHLMGMLSNGQSPHSDPDHLLALIEFTRKMKVENLYLHFFTDGRDSGKYASLKLIQDWGIILKNNEKIATVMGRFYAMDRKKKWSRTEKAFNALVLGKGEQAKSPEEAITKSYNQGLSDEFIEPHIITYEKNKALPRIQDNDSVIFFNLRSDRARQLTKVFAQTDFNKDNPEAFKRKKIFKNLCFTAMTDFGPDLDSVLTAFPGFDLKNTLPMILADLKQLYIAETEKYAHVTYFFNGGYSGKVDNEDQLVVSSPDVKSYDQVPLMKSKELTNVIIKNLNGKKWRYDFTLLNFAAPDMIGHTGNLEAGVECCQGIDNCIHKILDAYLKRDGTVIVTADHGNVEEMINLITNEIDTKHSINPVPFIIVNKKYKNSLVLRKGGGLCDIAPTILELLGKNKPKEMTGKSLLI